MSFEVGLASRGLRKQPSSLSAPKLFFFAHLEARSVFHDGICTTINGVENGGTLLDRAQLMGHIEAAQWNQPFAPDHS